MSDTPRRKKPLPRDAVLAARDRAAEWQARSAAAQEERHVRFLLERLHFPAGKKWAMLKLSRERTGVARLTLDLFNELVPNFPLLLGYANPGRLHQDNRATLPALFRRFEDAPFVAAYAALFEQAAPLAAGRTVGLLFPRKGVVRGLLMHNGLALWVPGTTITYHGGTREEPTQLVVQAFAAVVEALHAGGRGWKPDFAF